MSLDSDGLKYLTQLKMGLIELDWLQEEIREHWRDRVLANMAEPGFIGHQQGASAHTDYGWSVEDRAADGTMVFKTTAAADTLLDARERWARPSLRLAAVTLLGEFLPLPILDGKVLAGITVPDDGVWRTLVVRPVRVAFEAGAVDILAGSSTLTGNSETKFTRLVGKSDGGFGRGSLIRIDVAESGAGNEGVYEVDTVASDALLTLVTPVLGGTEAGVRVRIQGEFLGATPADPDIHVRVEPEWELVTAIRGTKAADGTLIVADLMRDGGVQPAAFVVDRRQSNRLRMITEAHAAGGYTLSPVVQYSGDPNGDPYGGAHIEAVQSWRRLYSPFVDGSANATHVDAKPMRDSDNILMVTMTALGNVEAADFLSRRLQVDAVTNLPRAIHSGASAFGGVGLERLPLSAGATHLVVYGEGSEIKARPTTDDGLTWGGAVTIWNPPLADALDTVTLPSILLTRDHRLIVIGSYFDNSAGQQSIRWIFSDDMGVTWDTNTNAGYILADPGNLGSEYSSIVQDAGGNIWTAYNQTAAGNLGMYLVRGLGPNDPTPGGADAEVVVANYEGSSISLDVDAYAFGTAPPSPSRTFSQPRLLAMPDSTLLVVHQHDFEYLIAGSGEFFSDLYCTTVAWVDSAARVTAARHLQRWDNSALATVRLWNGNIVQGRDGSVALIYNFKDDVTWNPLDLIRHHRAW